MAAWSTFTNGSSIDSLEILTAWQGKGCFLNLDHLVKDHVGDAKDDKAKEKCLFYQLLLVHIEEISSRGTTRPLPVMLGNGQSLDLYKLFSYVKEKGGYSLVSKKGLWDSVTKKLDLNLEVLASARLIYEKYLNEFEGWLRETIGGKHVKIGYHGGRCGFNSSPIELENEFGALSNLNRS
ncbi:hypothetical protein L6164_019444 [Bauhinia variegata]|uniref:Uncharacterized protein n=1 Tax=Bauhinia variegata TaxID=167791 RepID=A0ACB9MWL8_BAUVA|nr:hypothetical protein L6164_019444 [Bauhinia variegata]